jgi:hypothetical protein
MSLTLSGSEIVTRAFGTMAIFGAGEPVPAADLNLGFDLLKEFVDSLNTQALTVLVVERTVYDLVANKGTPANPYTIGPGGDFDTGTAARPMLLNGASLLLNSTAPYPTEIPLAIITDDMFQAIQQKGLLNSLPQTIYYNPTVPLGTITLWNVPNTSENDLVLYTDQLTANFSVLNAAYVCPPGYAKVFRLNVAKALLPFYGAVVGREISDDIKHDADEALKDIKLSNVKMVDLAMDPAFTPFPGGGYNIFTDTGA